MVSRKLKFSGIFHKQIKALYTKNQTLSAPTKELVLKEVDENQLQHRVWTENTLIRIEKHQCAVLLLGDKILGSRGTPGDYKLCSQEDISEAKVYFVRTDVVSGKIFESNTADSLGCYAYFERHTDSDNPDEEYLAGVLKNTGTEKQYIRFTKIAK